jgi:PAS domain S-box-containing protein
MQLKARVPIGINLGERLGLFLRASAISAALFVILLYGLDRIDSSIQQNRIEASTKADVKVSASRFKGLLKDYVGDLFVIAKLGQLGEFIRSPDQTTRAQLERIIATVAAEKPVLAQLRYIDAAGMEGIRVERTQRGVGIVPVERLQDKSDRYYFRDAVGLPPGSIFLSPLDLNVERGTIEEPWRPMVRLATPVFHSDGRRAGIVIVNILAQELIDELLAVDVEGVARTALVDENGYWLAGAPKEDLWGFMFGRDTRMGVAQPQLWTHITGRSSGGVWDGGSYYAFDSIDPQLVLFLDRKAPVFSNHSWKVLHIHYGGISGILDRQQAKWMVAVFVLLILLAAWSWSGSRQQAAATQRLLDQLVDNTNALISVRSTDGRYLMVNREFEEVYGIDRGMALGKRSEEFLPEDEARRKYEIDRLVLETGEPVQRETRIHQNGRERSVLSNRFPLRDTRGRIIAVAGIATDITERKRAEMALEARETELRGVMDNVVDGIITIDDRGTIESFNPAAERIFGYQPAQVLGRNIKMLMPESEQARHDSYIENFLRTGKGKIIGIGPREVTACRKDESSFPMNLAVSVMEIGGKKKFIGVVRDITKQKEAEAEVIASKEKAEQANQAKSAFLANMSHELRTPLNAIIGYTEMILEEAEDAEDDAYIPDLRKILSSGRHLLSLINDILDISKIEAGRLELSLEEIDYQSLAQEVRTALEPLIEKRGNRFSLRADGGPWLGMNDPLRLRQVFLNLLSNAAKFTENGEISFALGRETRPDGDWLTARVSDTGIGMSPEQIGNIFEDFSQGDSSISKKYEGTGLGLAISRRIVDLMGGTIEVESAAGEGSSFTVRIPMRIADKGIHKYAMSDSASASAGALSESRSRVTVLVIDDEVNAREIIARHLVREGFQVATAMDGRHGIDMAGQIHPNAITLDVLMDDLSGWEVLKILGESEKTQDIPVIMVTVVDDEQQALSLGAVGHISKPVDRELLTRVIDRHTQALRIAKPDQPVLVVEDDAATRELLVRQVRSIGFQAVEAENGLVALERLNEGVVPSMVLLDLMMPEMDGFTFLESFRARSDWNGIPVLVITAKDLTDEERRILRSESARILEKGKDRLDDVLPKLAEQIAIHTNDGEREIA